jgi:hypothetical protein
VLAGPAWIILGPVARRSRRAEKGPGHDLDTSGFVLRRGVLGAGHVRTLMELVCPGSGASPPSPHAVRNLLWDQAALAPTLQRIGVDALAAEALGAAPFAINVIYFDKTPAANWKVPAHQDLMMPVQRQVEEEPGFTGWTSKAGVVHVEPPLAVLTTLIALRIHLDDCAAGNGALALLPGSHRRGKLGDAELAALPRDDFTVCEAAAGDVLLMRPLIVHRSSPAAVPSHRRVLHVVYASEEPGRQVRWRRCV